MEAVTSEINGLLEKIRQTIIKSNTSSYICRQFIESMGGSISAEMDRNYLSIKITLDSA